MYSRKVEIGDSSQILNIWFDPPARKMLVEFVSASYEYTGITSELFGSLVASDSVGKHFASYVRPFYKGKVLE